MDILSNNEYTEVEDRYYLNPQVGLDESTSFIDNLRATQAQQNQQITDQTRMLGTDVPTSLGGLTGGESYFTSRYRTPQTVSAVANLRATAQAAALNQALQNEQAKWKKRYQDAYNAYQKRAWNRSNPSSGGGGGDDDDGDNPNFESTSSAVDIKPLTGKAGYASVVDMATGEIIDVPLDSAGGEVRNANTYSTPEQAGYILLGTPWGGAGTPGQHAYNTPSGETLYVNLEDGYKIRYDPQTDRLVQVKE